MPRRQGACIWVEQSRRLTNDGKQWSIVESCDVHGHTRVRLVSR